MTDLQHQKLACVAFLLCSVPQPLLADEDTAAPDAVTADESERRPIIVSEQVELGRYYLAHGVQLVTGAVDDFLSQDETLILNDSYLYLRLGQVFEEGGNHYDKNDISLKVDLPKTENRLMLVITSDPDEFESLEEQNQDRQSDEQTIRNTDGTTGALRFVLDEWHSWNPDLDIGLKAPLPLDPFIRLTLRRRYGLGDYWMGAMRHSVYHFHQEGFGEKSRFLAGRPLGENYFFTGQVEMQWQGEGGILEFDNVVSLRHYISKRNVLTYSTGVFVEEHPDPHTRSYYVDASLRRRLYKDWVYGVIRPAVTWEEETDFEAVVSLTLRLEAYFRE